MLSHSHHHRFFINIIKDTQYLYAFTSANVSLFQDDGKYTECRVLGEKVDQVALGQCQWLQQEGRHPIQQCCKEFWASLKFLYWGH